MVPKYAHGMANLKMPTASTTLILDAILALYDRIMNQNLLVRRINVTANHVVAESEVRKHSDVEQLDLFTDYNALRKERAVEEADLEREKRLQKTLVELKKKFGKNAVLKGMNLQEGATTIERNQQIGGHKV